MRSTLPVFFSPIRMSLVPMNAIVLGVTRPLDAVLALRFGSSTVCPSAVAASVTMIVAVSMADPANPHLACMYVLLRFERDYPMGGRINKKDADGAPSQHSDMCRSSI